MPIFAITLKEPNPEVVELITKEYPDCYQLSDTVFLVSQNTVSETIAKTVGIKGEDRIESALGAVFRLNGAYAGYASRSLWEWLGEMEKRNFPIKNSGYAIQVLF